MRAASATSAVVSRRAVVVVMLWTVLRLPAHARDSMRLRRMWGRQVSKQGQNGQNGDVQDRLRDIHGMEARKHGTTSKTVARESLHYQGVSARARVASSMVELRTFNP